MATCIHGVSDGNYCRICQKVIKPLQLELDLSHYMQAPDKHKLKGDCERCKRAKAFINACT